MAAYSTTNDLTSADGPLRLVHHDYRSPRNEYLWVTSSHKMSLTDINLSGSIYCTYIYHYGDSNPTMTLAASQAITFGGDVTFNGATSISGETTLKDFVATVDYTDCTESDTSQDIDISSGFPTNVVIYGAMIELDNVFSDTPTGTISAVTASIGDAGGAAELMTATDVFTGAPLGWKTAPGTAAEGFLFEAAYSPIVQINTTSANVDTLTEGSLEAHIFYFVPELSTP